MPYLQLLTPSKDAHTGTERYRVEYALMDIDDRYDRKGAYVEFTVSPDTVVLVWERPLRGEWRRHPWPKVGSHIQAWRVLKDGTLSDKQGNLLDVFRYDGKLTEYAASLPGLPELVAKIEAELPA